MGRVVNATPQPLCPREWDPVPIVKEARWVPGPLWEGTENSAPPEFDPQTFQPVASRHTDCTIPVLKSYYLESIMQREYCNASKTNARIGRGSSDNQTAKGILSLLPTIHYGVHQTPIRILIKISCTATFSQPLLACCMLDPQLILVWYSVNTTDYVFFFCFLFLDRAFS